MAERKKFLLRIEPKVYAALQRWADDELRSVNQHIEFLLREALRKSDRLPKASSIDAESDVSGSTEIDKADD